MPGQLAKNQLTILLKGKLAAAYPNVVKLRCLATQSSGYSDNYQYMQCSKVPTMHFQKSLPRLPIPEVEKTCERFLKATQPLLSPAQYADTEMIVQSFKQQQAPELNSLLKAKDEANKHTSYISEPW